MLRTNGLGIGIMVSTFVSQEFGLGTEISKEDLVKINTVQADKLYTDKEVATYLCGDDCKRPLIETPFVEYLSYGAGKDGYWAYCHMVIQIEDFVDCLLFYFPIKPIALSLITKRT